MFMGREWQVFMGRELLIMLFLIHRSVAVYFIDKVSYKYCRGTLSGGGGRHCSVYCLGEGGERNLKIIILQLTHNTTSE